MIRILLILALLTAGYYLVPGAKTKADTTYLNYQHRGKVNSYQKDQVEGKIKILVPTDQL